MSYLLYGSIIECLTGGNRIIGEGKALAIQLGPNDMVTVRGSPADVAGAVKEVKEVVEEAKMDEIESGFVRHSFGSTTCMGTELLSNRASSSPFPGISLLVLLARAVQVSRSTATSSM